MTLGFLERDIGNIGDYTKNLL